MLKLHADLFWSNCRAWPCSRCGRDQAFVFRRIRVMRVGIVGLGAVGAGIAKMFRGASVYDEPKSLGSRAEVNGCDIAFVCVPTPAAADGSCDTSIVEDVVSWLEADVICIRSTVSV